MLDVNGDLSEGDAAEVLRKEHVTLALGIHLYRSAPVFMACQV